MSSILVPMSRGYLIEIAGYRAPSQRPFVVKEADRLAVKIRDRFGKFDESDKELCASTIRAIMKAEANEAQRKAELDNKRRLEANREAYVNRVMAEAREREETNERLRHWLGN